MRSLRILQEKQIEAYIEILPDALINYGVTASDYIRAEKFLADFGAQTEEEDSGTKRRECLFAPAVTMFGEEWQSKLARATGYSQGHLSGVFLGNRSLTDQVERAVVRAYRREIVLAEERAACATAGIIRILQMRCNSGAVTYRIDED
jgi:hypothetical protein